MPDPKRNNPTTPEPDRDPVDGDLPADRDEPAPRLISPEDEDRKVRRDEKRPFGVMP